MKMVSIIIVNYKDPKDTLSCLVSLNSLSYEEHEIIVVDNGSESDKTSQFIHANNRVKVINLVDNSGFASGANAGIKMARGKYILLLNNDTEVTANMLEPMVKAMESNDKIGMLSPQIRFFHNKELIQYAGASNIHPILGRGTKLGYKEKVSEKYNTSGYTELCNGACMLIRRHVIEDVGLLPENYFMYYEEHDFTETAKALGWKCYYCAESKVYHKSGGTIGQDSPLRNYYLLRNRLVFQRKFQNGFSLVASLIYHTIVIYPKSFIQAVLKKDRALVESVLKAYSFHIKN